ncbi:MAG: GeoRSP system PqqD family peptide chaperone [Deltaproteobacteria bacterium]|nr:GeoRSP system PqqD family peptide chaperone [Deltaproteobacteria bacterium]
MGRYYQHADVVWREEDSAMEQVETGLESGDDISDIATSVLLLNGKMLSLNVLGTETWKLCKGKTVEDLVGVLVEEFEVEFDRLQKDIEGFLDDMKKHGFIYEK